MRNDRIISGLKEVVESLQQAHQEYPKGRLDMSQGLVRDTTIDYQPGTCHCFAGWYGVINRHIFDPSDRRWFYLDAVDYIARLCGFVTRYEMMDWAEQNADIWGNSNGGAMFCDEVAFNNAKSLNGIIKHLRGVIKRLEKAQ